MGPKRGEIPAMDIARALFQVVIDLFSLLFLLTRSRGRLAAENLFLRKQLAFYKERSIKPGRTDSASRFTLVALSRLFDWKGALAIVQPKILIRWRREGFRMLWRRKSKMGRPPIPEDLKNPIRRMARENPLWGEERIANELLLKLASGYRPERYGNTCRKSHLGALVESRAGLLSCEIMLGQSWHAISLWS